MALSPDQQKARALKILEAKIMEGKTTAEICQEFGISPGTVYKAMSLARKAEIVVNFEDRMYNELLPLAHAAVLGALADGNAKIGLAVLQGTQVLRPNQQRSANAVAEDDELARYINQKRAKAALEERTHDAEFTPVPAVGAIAGGVAEGARITSSLEGERTLDPVQRPESGEVVEAGTPQDLPPGFASAQTILNSSSGSD